MKKFCIVLAAVTLMLLVSSCDRLPNVQITRDMSDETMTIERSGTESIYRLDVSRLTLNMNRDTPAIRVIPAATASVTLICSVDFNNYGLSVTIENGVISISTEHNHIYADDNFSLTVRATLSNVQLDGGYNFVMDGGAAADDFRITTRGAVNANITNLRTESIAATVEGVGSLTLTGNTDRSDIRINGIGNIAAREFVSTNAEVRVTGAGNIELSATTTLYASIRGTGTIRYWGSPTLERSIVGVGRIERRGSVVFPEYQDSVG